MTPPLSQQASAEGSAESDGDESEESVVDQLKQQVADGEKKQKELRDQVAILYCTVEYGGYFLFFVASIFLGLIFSAYVCHVTTAGSLEDQLKCANQSIIINQSSLHGSAPCSHHLGVMTFVRF